MMFLTAVDVCLRYFFNRPIGGVYELTEYMLLVMISFAIAQTAITKGHVSIDLVTTRLPSRARLTINCVTSLISLGLYSLIVKQSIVNIKMVYDTKLVSAVLLIPSFPFVILLSLGMSVFCLVILIDFIDSLSRLDDSA
jgi:TRAP-type C4-dicarboxylate transport system permease small subunit